MRSLILFALSSVIAAVDAAPTQRQLDPAKPADALAIIELLTRQASWPGMTREQVEALDRALATLSAVVQPKPEAVEVKKP